MTTIDYISETSLQNADEVILAGSGMMEITGFDTTALFFELISTDLNDAILFVNFTAENDPGGEGAGGPVMPEPNAALMFALGLGIVSRSIRKRR